TPLVPVDHEEMALERFVEAVEQGHDGVPGPPVQDEQDRELVIGRLEQDPLLHTVNLEFLQLVDRLTHGTLGIRPKTRAERAAPVLATPSPLPVDRERFTSWSP